MSTRTSHSGRDSSRRRGLSLRSLLWTPAGSNQVADAKKGAQQLTRTLRAGTQSLPATVRTTHPRTDRLTRTTARCQHTARLLQHEVPPSLSLSLFSPPILTALSPMLPLVCFLRCADVLPWHCCSLDSSVVRGLLAAAANRRPVDPPRQARAPRRAASERIGRVSRSRAGRVSPRAGCVNYGFKIVDASAML